MTRQWQALLLVAVASASLLVGCGSDEEFPTGTYVSTADVNDLGPVTVTYGDDGTLTIEQEPDLVVSGTYTVDGDQITLSDDFCLREGQETADYTWDWDGSTLTMTTTKDACASRQESVKEMNPVE